MRVPLSWMCDYAPFDRDPAELAGALDDLGLVVEEVQHIGAGLGDVVVARVLDVGPIPGADRIRRVVVDAGGEPVEVVCGAWNFQPGDVVPFAPAGATLPGGLRMERRRIRGVVSNGMLCSGRELGLSDDQEGILVLGSGPDTFEPGAPFVEALGIERDVVFDIAVEANRPDAWCVAGVARDLAAALGLPFAIADPAPVATDPSATAADLTTVEVVDDDLCPRFTARVLLDVEVQDSPTWLARRLTLAGMRPINNVVDASNYVMLDLGQPTHPYDLDRVAGGGLRVRAARPGEHVVTLDGIERVLGEHAVGVGDDRRDCLICDAHDAPIGIGGVMGGATTDIAAATGTVLLEAAYFSPMAIARTSKRLGLRTEASARFERGCDPEGIDRAAGRLCELLAATSGPSFRQAQGVVDVRGPVPGPTRVHVRTARVNSLLGSQLDDTDVVAYLEPIGFRVQRPALGELAVTVPTFRPDTAREVDVIEEIARHHGYGRLPRRRPFAPQVGRLSPYQRERRLVREIVAGLGAHEAWTASLLAPDDHRRVQMGPGIRVTNPLAPDESELRQGLLPGVLRALAFNADRRQGELRLFEVGHVFPPPDGERVARALEHNGATVVDEREMLGVALADAGDDARAASEAWQVLSEALGIEGVDMVAPVEGSRPEITVPPGLHPTRAACLVLRDTAQSGVVGVVGEVDPAVLDAFGLGGGRRVGWIEVDLGRLLESAPRRSQLLAPVTRFPSSDVDLAFVVDDGVPAAVVLQTLQHAGGELLESAALFDVYRAPGARAGERSLTFRLRFRSFEHTLTDDEVGAVRSACIVAVEEAHGARLRT
ncbi:MAG TPA: phenylalanine--tRNA ligase subunit beta [Acidimicrobiales bacterium]|nr:phenylalanine--tRNA ligase subunit beta [Acidimicrobiales bacterium]